jgi:rRNA maturation RNase YbeY
MSRILGLRNRQQVRAVDARLLRRIARWALEEQFRAADYELGLHLVTAAEMALLNQKFLQHEGSTDVLTFDHRPAARRPSHRPPFSVAATVRSQVGFVDVENTDSNIQCTSSASRDLTVAATPTASRDVTVVATPRKGSRPVAIPRIHGEIFLCLDEAVAQARKFDANWQSELARYLFHGLLHLHGFDDLTPDARRRMKRQETRLLLLAQRQFPLRRLARPRR